MRARRGVAALRSWLGLAVIGTSLSMAPREAKAELPSEEVTSHGEGPAALGCQAPPDPIGESDPGTLLELALSCYDVERYTTALALLEHLDARAPNPTVVFNLGAVHAAMGHCREATRYYRQYLDQTRSESGREEARHQLELLGACAGAASGAVSPLPTEAPGALAAPAKQTSPRLLPERLPEQHDDGVWRVATWVMFGGSAAFLLASGGLAYAGEREEKRRAPGERGDTVAAAERQGQRYNTLAWACAGGALALASSGFVLLAFEPGESTQVSVTSGEGRAMSLSVEHRF